MKRGRGRPRKNSMHSNLSNTQNSYLEEGKYEIPAYWIQSANLLAQFIDPPPPCHVYLIR